MAAAAALGPGGAQVFSAQRDEDPFNADLKNVQDRIAEYWNHSVGQQFQSRGLLEEIEEAVRGLRQRIIHLHDDRKQKKIAQISADLIFCRQCCAGTVPTFTSKIPEGAEREAALRGLTLPETVQTLFITYTKEMPSYFQCNKVELSTPLLNTKRVEELFTQEGMVGLPLPIDESVCKIPSDGSYTYDTIAGELSAICEALKMEDTIFARYAAHHAAKGEQVTKESPITDPLLIYSCLETEILLAITENRTGGHYAIPKILKEDKLLFDRAGEFSLILASELSNWGEVAPHFSTFLYNMASTVANMQIQSRADLP